MGWFYPELLKNTKSIIALLRVKNPVIFSGRTGKSMILPYAMR